jgi:putative transposase
MPPGYVESFNGKFRDELLNGELFLGLADARWVSDRWRLDYNHRRRHSALVDQTPAVFAADCVLEDSATLDPPEHRTTTDPKFSHSKWYKIWG